MDSYWNLYMEKNEEERDLIKRRSQLIHERDQMWASLREIEGGIEQTNNLLRHCIDANTPTIAITLIDAKLIRSCVMAVLSELMLYKVDSNLQEWKI